MEIIYCANGNPRFAQIAVDHGFLYGAQLPGSVYHPVFFADQDWKKPDRGKYMAALAKHKPTMASVLDLERFDQLPEVLSWAEEAAAFVDVVMIIPKVPGIIDILPRIIAGAAVRLGYSIPTRHGGTIVNPVEFQGWPVHLLGGSPQRQMLYSQRFDLVASIDGNYAKRMAAMYCEFWMDGRWHELSDHGYHERNDAMYEAFDWSCKHIMAAWKRQGTFSDLPLFAEATP